MTRREKYMQEHPNVLLNKNGNPMASCPDDIATFKCSAYSNCTECWNQEIPEENEKKEETDMKPIKFNKDSTRKCRYAIIEIPEGYGEVMTFTLTGRSGSTLNVFNSSYNLDDGVMIRLDKEEFEKTGKINYIQE